MKKYSIYILYNISLLAIIACLLSSCNGSKRLPQNTDSILGLWLYCDTITGDEISLVLRDDNKAFYTYTHEQDASFRNRNKYNNKVFLSFTLSGDSLIMTDKDACSTTLIIADYNDSTIVFENTTDICHTVCLKRINRTPNIGIYEYNNSADIVYNYPPGPNTIPDISGMDPRLYPMAKEDMEAVRSLIIEFMDPISFQKNYKQCVRERWGIDDSDECIGDYSVPLAFEEYNRSYVSVYDGDDIITYVTMVAKGEAPLQDPFILPSDGGNAFVEIYVSLKKKKVLNFLVHGRA